MVRVILKRIGLAFLTLFGVTVIVFALLQMMPGEPIDSIVPLDASEELRQVIIDQYGFDQPLYMQYFMWLGNAVRGNFGNSVSDNRLVLSVVSEALHNTLILALGASIFAFLLSILIGVYSSYRPNSIFSWIGTVFGIGGISISKLLPVIDPDWYLLRHPAPAAVYRHVYQWGLYLLLPHTAPDSSRYRGRRHDTGDYDADGAQLSLRDAQPELCHYPAGEGTQ